MDYKVGDKVRVRADLVVNKQYNDGCFFDSEMAQYRGKVAIIEHIQFNNTRYELDIDKGGWNWTDAMLEPAEPAPKFAIGDKVVPVSKRKASLLTACNSWGYAGGKEQGYLYVIKDNGDYYSCWPKKDSSHGDHYLKSDLIPYVELPKHKFSVGDKVRAIAVNHGWGDVKKGDIGIIIDVSNLYGDYLADFPNQSGWGGSEHCFELVVDEPPEVKPAPVKDKPFKVGDRVRNIKEYFGKSECVGKIGTVIKVGDNYYLVQFNENIDGHAGIHKGVGGKRGYYWCFEPEYLELAEPEPKPQYHATLKGERPINQAPEDKTTYTLIAFIVKGAKTVCVLDIDGKQFIGKAKCCPTDVWDEDKGKCLAHIRATRKMINWQEKELRGK
jgi:hypothetical protein